MQKAEIIMSPPSNQIKNVDGDPVVGKYASRSNLNHFFLNRNQLPRQLNSCNFFQDMQEAEIIMSPPSKKIKNVDGDPVEVNMQAAVIWIAAINKDCTQLSQ